MLLFFLLLFLRRFRGWFRYFGRIVYKRYAAVSGLKHYIRLAEAKRVVFVVRIEHEYAYPLVPAFSLYRNDAVKLYLVKLGDVIFAVVGHLEG